MSLPATFIRLESIIVFGAAVMGYVGAGYDGWLFVALFFTPDLSALGYLAGPRVGAVSYNSLHNFGLPVAGLVLGMTLHSGPLTAYCLIWLAHVAFDRSVGFGLMRPTRFGDSNVADIDLRKFVRFRRNV